MTLHQEVTVYYDKEGNKSHKAVYHDTSYHPYTLLCM